MFKTTSLELVGKVRELAAEYPDRTARCQYVNRADEPECIVGRALFVLGMSIDELKSLFRTSVSELMTEVDGINKNRLPSDPNVRWLQEVQSSQDAGCDWARSVHLADRGTTGDRMSKALAASAW